MEEPRRSSLDDRVERLEKRVAELHGAVEDLREALREQENGGNRASETTAEDAALQNATSESAPRVPTTSSADAPPSVTSRFEAWVREKISLRSEDWLNRIGIALLLLGLSFLFKYSVDQGWLVPAVRVAFGVALGGGLLWSGLHVQRVRSALSQVLLGGSSAAFYITVFAAHQLYGLIPYAAGFAGMVVVTAGTFALAIRQDGAALGVIGAVAGLGIPFVLDPGPDPNVAGLVGYAVLLLAGMAAIYLYRGWRSLIATSAVGGWLVLLTAVIEVSGSASTFAQWVVQGGLGATWLLLGGVPVLRAWLHARSPEQWPRPDWPLGSRLPSLVSTPPAYALVSASPLLAFTASQFVWNGVPDAVWSSIALVGAGLYAAAYLWMRQDALTRYAPAHALVAAVLAAIGLAILLDGAALLVALGVEMLMLHWAARQLSAPVLRWTGHAFAFLVAMVWIEQIETVEQGVWPIVHAAGLSELAVLICVLTVPVVLASTAGRNLYRAAALGGWLAWSWQELAVLANGDAYTSAVWGATVLILLVAAARRNTAALQYAAAATLVVFVGKLFLVDLARLSALWRILLFLGFGTAFLALSYALSGWWSRSEET